MLLLKSIVIIYLLFACVSNALSQQNSLLIHSYFKDRLFDNSKSKSYQGSSFLPAFESEYDLNYINRDSSILYYDGIEVLFKKHLFEVKGTNYFFTISPIVDFSIGKDRKDTTNRRLFQNTRGVFIEGDLFKNFSFTTAIYENQSRLTHYESNYYSSVGELYPNQSTGIYTTQNAVIPGSGRTKPFKADGFDYGYAVGNIVYKPHRSILLTAGNTSQFIGDGYRSLFLSDNGVSAPFLRGIFQLSKKWQFNYFRMLLINLMRRPLSSSVESYYETKGFSANYLTYQPTKKISISLFEGIIWSKGDSIVSKSVNPLFYNPVPFVAEFALAEKEINSVLGLNLSYSPYLSHRLYGQFAIGNLNTDQIAFQFGYRVYNYFGLKNFMLQLEYNNVSKDMYSSNNPRLNYSHYNLPLGPVKGNDFQEVIFRSNYEIKRVYLDVKSILYLLKDYTPLDLLAVDKKLASESGTIFLQQIELGYRFNKKMNWNVYGSWQFRSENLSKTQLTNQFSIGLRTGINNHYNDF